jgi:N6-L-threonylcarbamoyladenine synthase
MLCLGIETSCDETSIALVEDGWRVRVNMVSSQVDLHARYGGVVPELACRKHSEVLNPLLQEALSEGGATFADINLLAVSNGPGLVGALLLGVAAAKALAGILGKPIVGVNHLEGHLYANFLVNPSIPFPVLALLVSGGHTNLILMKDHGSFTVLGKTLDDAAGEAFDKVGKALSLPYPGGPVIDRLAKSGDPKRIAFPRPLLGPGSLDFSFSGLKTSVINYLRLYQGEASTEDICASFQEAVVDTLVRKTVMALERTDAPSLMLAGGVASNSRLRAAFEEIAQKRALSFFVPAPGLCTDNAAMIACAGYHRFIRGFAGDLFLDVNPGLSLL